MHRRPTFRRPFALALALALVALGAWSASATVNPRTFTLNVTPGSVPVGSTVAMSAVIKNTGTYPLGSVDLTAPGPLVISDVGSTLGSSTFAGHVVHLRDLSLAPGGSFTAYVYGTLKCNAYPSLAWKATGRQENDFTGSAFTLKAAGSSKAFLSTGHCSLAFVTDHQPQDAHPSDRITDTDFNTGGGPVQVEILDGAGVRATGISGTIAVAIGANPVGGVLSGTTSRLTSAGVASFNNLSIDQPGVDYTLVASSSGLGTATSDMFTIADLLIECTPFEDCVGNLSEGATSGEVNALADPSGPRLAMSILTGGPDCPGYVEHSGTLDFTVTSLRSKEATIGFDTGLSPYYVHPEAFQVCYQSPNPFMDRDDALVTLGLLPDCVPYGDEVLPCVVDRTAEGSMVFVTFKTPAGDPKGRV